LRLTVPLLAYRLVRRERWHLAAVMLDPGLLYFAYGCHMDSDLLSGLLGIRLAPGWPARLSGRRLVFNKGGEGEDGARVAANLVEDRRCLALGVVYRLPHGRLAKLDEFEGAPEHYRREVLWVEPLSRRARQAALVYIAQPAWIVKESLPDESYLAHLIGGATRNRLPRSYVVWLAALARGKAKDCYRALLS
jgi:cation transport regulator ChaC